ncbi:MULTISPECIES: TetR/AcrR family transcriptional regulator [Ignavibacterium]|jgi:TetR/AcrR family transcriptional repressor of mexJK operon|uniref:TetR/AcrR family transcriptional regulator n=1 Tax=Ignavibacterium TaxID=795750 RepID=UPI0025B7B55D|nr:MULTISPECIES: TetR/AcrR family transcriptional regulator [Ignavibacterium]MBI5663098.1 TetR/AcrR family transcriptional regulator [Ignavibacterium album]
MKNNDRKMQIIKSADKRFSRHGFHKTNMDEIARDIRIGKPTLYYYFESKDALYSEVIKWEFENFLEMVNQIFSNEELSIQKRFEEYFLKKDSVHSDFKLIFEIIVQFISESTTEAETELLKTYLFKEEEIIKKILTNFYKDKLKAVSKSLPYSIVNLSWMVVVGRKMSSQLTSEKEFLSTENIQRIIESLLN